MVLHVGRYRMVASCPAIGQSGHVIQGLYIVVDPSIVLERQFSSIPLFIDTVRTISPDHPRLHILTDSGEFL